VQGVPTTAGSRAVERRARAAPADAPCLAGARAAGARIVGKVNLHELAAGATGVNPWFGTPVNPQAADRVPGGSSSGSAVVVGAGDADVALGTDTAGSVRIPSACCATAGLKTTYGRIPTDGMWPLAQSLDTVGPMARDVAGLVLGMQLLEPGFRIEAPSSLLVGRVRLPEVDPSLEAAVDDALALWGVQVEPISLPTWAAAVIAGGTVALSELSRNFRELVASDPSGVGEDVRAVVGMGAALDEAAVRDATSVRDRWLEELATAFDRVALLALPTLVLDPPRLTDPPSERLVAATVPVNLAGNPALALPLPRPGKLAASLQLIAPHGGEELLLGAGLELEAAVAAR